MPYHLDLGLAITEATANQPVLCRSTQVGLLHLLFVFHQGRLSAPYQSSAHQIRV